MHFYFPINSRFWKAAYPIYVIASHSMPFSCQTNPTPLAFDFYVLSKAQVCANPMTPSRTIQILYSVLTSDSLPMEFSRELRQVFTPESRQLHNTFISSSGTISNRCGCDGQRGGRITDVRIDQTIRITRIYAPTGRKKRTQCVGLDERAKGSH